MKLSPDQTIFWEYGFLKLNLTIVTTWGLMAVAVVGAWLVSRRLTSEVNFSKWQNFLEIIVSAMRQQLADLGLRNPERYLPFTGSLFLFVGLASLGTIIPGYHAPTGSLSTTTALALCVFVAVPIFGIGARGFLGYLKSYLHPTFLMLPFNIISELSRTLALAVRLFGNMMSGALIAGIIVALVPLFFPILLNALELLTGIVQAYIFSILAAVYIAAATHEEGAPIKKAISTETSTGA